MALTAATKRTRTRARLDAQRDRWAHAVVERRPDVDREHLRLTVYGLVLVGRTSTVTHNHPSLRAVRTLRAARP